MLKTVRHLIEVLAVLSTVAAAATESKAATPDAKPGYASVNGLRLYYEVHGARVGSAPPLILLHGGLGSGDMFGPNVALLAAKRQVITVDFQANGHTADIARPFGFDAFADDVAALAKTLKLEQVDVAGYSLGGIVAINLAARYPKLVRKLVVVSSAVKKDGWYPEIQQGMSQVGAASAEPMKQTPMYAAYAKIAPRLADWPVLLQKTGDLLRQDYDYSKAFAALTIPVLIVAGDADAVRTAHLVEAYKLLGGGQRDAGWDGAGKGKSRLAILPGKTHYDIFLSPEVGATIDAFL